MMLPVENYAHTGAEYVFDERQHTTRPRATIRAGVLSYVM